MRMIFLGPPGAGKGTQAGIISEKLNIIHVSTGEILRSAIKNETELGKQAKSYIDKGELVPDRLVVDIIKDRLSQSDAESGYILDGFPRNLEQAKVLDDILASMSQKIDHAINVDVPDNELVVRLLERARKEGRTDDNETVIKNRLKVYNESTLPLINYYKEKNILIDIDGVGDIDEITNSILSSIRK